MVALAAPLSVSAHVTQTDGTINALLHVNPDDDAEAGRAASLGFSINDSSGRFQASACDCRLVVRDGARTVYRHTVAAPEILSRSVIVAGYTFTYRAVYRVELAGAPRNGQTFQPFRLRYDVRVARGPVRPGTDWGFWGATGLVLGTMGLVAVVVRRELRYDTGAKAAR